MAIKITSPSVFNPSLLGSVGPGSVLNTNLPESFVLSTARPITGFFTEILSGNTPASTLPAPPPDFLTPPTFEPPPDDPPPPEDPPDDPLQFCVQLLGGTYCPTVVTYCEGGVEKSIYVLAAGA